MPILKDVVAHTFFKMQHMATVHYENGKYHVHTEMAEKATNNEPSAGTENRVEVKETLNVHTNNSSQLLFSQQQSSRVFKKAYLEQASENIVIASPTPPPEA